MQNYEVLTGSISLTNVSDLIQFIGMSGKTGELVLTNEQTGVEGQLFFCAGQLTCVLVGLNSGSAKECSGVAGLAEIISWESGQFQFTRDVTCPSRNVEMPLNHAIMEAARLADENGSDGAGGSLFAPFDEEDGEDLFIGFGDEPEVREMLAEKKRVTQELKKAEIKENIKETLASLPAGFGRVPHLNSWSASWKAIRDPEPDNSQDPGSSEPGEPFGNPQSTIERSENVIMRESTEILSDLLKVPGVDAVVVAGRDGFIIEAAGSSTRINIDDLGAAIANTINGIEEMGNELNVNKFQDLFIEYGRAVIMCKPVGDAIAAIITPDASKLGIIRHKAHRLFDELREVF